MQFVLSEFAVAVLVESLEGSRRVGDLFGRELAIVVRVEHLHQRIARGSVPTPPAFRVAIGRTLAFVIAVTPRRTFRRLRDDNRCAQGAKHTDDPQRSTHGQSPKCFQCELAELAPNAALTGHAVVHPIKVLFA
jgi:hypothetical protein